MIFNLQPTLCNNLVMVDPLSPSDFEKLYEVASDPLIWEQHPNPDRYKREIFETYFKGAIESAGAFLVSDATTGQAIGSSRYYELDVEKSSVAIGYTFFGRRYWGGQYNPALKALMINHAFQFVNNIYFHIGAANIRSQKAISRLGASKIGEIEMEYYGEQSKLNFIYLITKENWNGN